MFKNEYRDIGISLQNLALSITTLSPADLIAAKRDYGMEGVLKALSEKVKPLVTVDEMNAAIAKAVAEALAAHTAEQHAGSGTAPDADADQPETEA